MDERVLGELGEGGEVEGRMRPDWPRSFLRRQGHVTRAQKRALREVWPRYGVECPYGVVLDFDVLFGRAGVRRALDIGFGMGDTLVARALDDPSLDILGVEVHRPGLGAALLKIEAAGVENVRVVRHDVFALLSGHLPPASLDEVTIFFPEPWPRERDAHRRIVRPLMLDLLVKVCRPGALLRVATDVEEYARHALAVLMADARWRNLSADNTFVERCAWRPVTPYEQTGLDEGRSIWDLAFMLSP